MTGTTTQRWAAIVDGDNVVAGGGIELREARELFARLRALTRGMPTTCALQRPLGMRYLPAYAQGGWRIRFATTAPDAADLELIDVATSYVAHGVTDLLVVSGDHAFAAMAGHARLHVVSRRRSLSHRLRSVSHSVAYFDDPSLVAA